MGFGIRNLCESLPIAVNSDHRLCWLLDALGQIPHFQNNNYILEAVINALAIKIAWQTRYEIA